jgi:hypothetical protein
MLSNSLTTNLLREAYALALPNISEVFCFKVFPFTGYF